MGCAGSEEHTEAVLVDGDVDYIVEEDVLLESPTSTEKRVVVLCGASMRPTSQFTCVRLPVLPEYCWGQLAKEVESKLEATGAHDKTVSGLVPLARLSAPQAVVGRDECITQ